MYLVKKFSSTQIVLVLVGGHAQRLLPFIRLILPDVTHVLVIDAADEILKLGPTAKSVHVQLFPLGVGHTAQTLTMKLPDELRKYLASVGGMDATGGLGQALAVGNAAGRMLVESPEFQEFIRRTLLPKLRRLSGGALKKIRLLFAGSLAGATYAGAVREIACALTKQFIELTSATISVEFLATGGLTYEGLGDRTWQNSACALTELLAYVTDPNRSPRESRRVRLLEFEVLGMDEALRDAYLAQVEQAAHSEWVLLDSQRREPNDSLNGRFGNVQTWEVAFGNSLDPSSDVAAVANEVYGIPIADALNSTSTSSMAEALEFEHARVRRNNASVENIADDAADRIAERAIAELRAPSYRDEVQIFLRRSANERVNIFAYESLWASAPTTCSEAAERLQLQRCGIYLLEEEAKNLFERRQVAEASIAIEISKFRRIHKRLNPAGIKDALQSALSSTSSKYKKLTDAAVRIRELSDELVELAAEESAADRAASFLKRAYEYLRGKLTQLLAALRDAGPPLGNATPRVTLYSLDEEFTNLWNAADEPPSAFLDALRRSVKYATLAGLAKITGAKAPEVEEIAKAILSGDAYKTPAVPWGGRSRADQGRTLHVLPPLAPESKRLLSEAALRRNPGAVLAFADGSPVVVNVVAVTMRLVRRLGDVLTEPYLLGLKEALNSKSQKLFLSNDLESLKSLEIEFSDGKVSIPS